VAEYAVVTAMVATLALAIGTIPDAQLARRLPTTVANARLLVADSARRQKVDPAQARAALARAPFRRAPLRYLYAEGWIRGTKDQVSCVFAKATPGSTSRNVATAIRRDRGLLVRLGRMKVGVGQAADALLRGVSSAC
jgi:hypothetical protein